ncbi:hypothetical protein AKG60_25555 [Vibrio parahaemolyticus]|uniref:ABC transporter permease n=3 Tax=Vibrio parahaemolyticus TaxID=670 RepID=A0AAX0M4I6_VIBPH|nr:hypothetical protein [Vibrio parahaemolyticus]EJG0766566.1 hypothetical protein [Vibrio parahaemolyticus O5:K30]OQJ96312.1 hypothetical protein AKG60_25555 [Vibrio parahaemolyticus]
MNKSEEFKNQEEIDKTESSSYKRLSSYILLLSGICLLYLSSQQLVLPHPDIEMLDVKPRQIMPTLLFGSMLFIAIALSSLISIYDKSPKDLLTVEEKFITIINRFRIKVENPYLIILISIFTFLFLSTSILTILMASGYMLLVRSEFSSLFEFGSHFGFTDSLINSAFCFLSAFLFTQFIFKKSMDKEHKSNKANSLTLYCVFFGILIPSLLVMLPFSPRLSADITKTIHIFQVEGLGDLITGVLSAITLFYFFIILMDIKNLDFKKAVFATFTSYSLMVFIISSINGSIINERFDESEYIKSISINNKEYTYKVGTIADKGSDLPFAIEAYAQDGLRFNNVLDELIYYSKGHEVDTIKTFSAYAEKKYQLIEKNKDKILSMRHDNLSVNDFLTLHIAKHKSQKQIPDEFLIYNLVSNSRYQEAIDIYLNKLMNSEKRFIPIEGKEIKYLIGTDELPSMMTLIVVSGKAHLDTSKIQDQETKDKWEKELNRVREIYNRKKPLDIRLTPEEAEEIRSWF